MDPYERELLLANPFIKLMLRERAHRDASPRAAAETVLKQELAAQAPSDDELNSLERAMNDALGALPPETTKALFAGTLEVKELADIFSLTVAQLAKSARGSEEGQALGLDHLWPWYWQRDVVAYRRFLLGQRLHHDVLDQRPSFWRPGVPAKPFWELGELDPALRTLEEHAGDIRRELDGVRRDGGWLPYRGVRGVRDEPIRHPKGDAYSSWNAYFFYHPFRGRFAEAHERCPVTSRVIEALPGLCRRELVLFSALVPGAVVPPHQGPFNGRLRVHLALTGSKGCYLRVGTQIREWVDGKVLVFDDSHEHQVCHRGADVRVVLMFNMVQPGMPTDVLDRAAQSAVEDYAETPEDTAARESLARTGWW